MNDNTAIQAALKCLLQLDENPATAEDISERSGVELATCRQLLARLRRAGIVTLDAQYRFALLAGMEDLSTVDLIDAVWVTPRG